MKQFEENTLLTVFLIAPSGKSSRPSDDCSIHTRTANKLQSSMSTDTEIT